MFPDDRLFAFEQAAILRLGVSRLAFHPLEGEPALCIDRIHLFDPMFLDQDDIALSEAVEIFVDPILYTTFPLLWQTVKPFPSLSEAKPDGIHIALWLYDWFFRVIGRDTERIDDVCFRQTSRFPQSSCL